MTRGRNLNNLGLDSSFVRHEKSSRIGEAVTKKNLRVLFATVFEGLRDIFRIRKGVDGFAYVFDQFFFKIYYKKTSHWRGSNFSDIFQIRKGVDGFAYIFN